MQPVLNIDDVKRVEVALTREGVSVAELMRRAGFAAARESLEFGVADNIVVLVGLGNNGGDGWVAAEALHGRGINVTVVSPIEPDALSGDLARQVAQSAERAGVSVVVGPSRDELEVLLATADVVLDCMLGTGFHGGVRPPFDIWIECVNACPARVVSVDVPSGLSAETGRAEGACVVADMTVTMLSLKPGLLADDGRDVTGAIVVAPLAEQTERLVIDEDPVAWRTDLADYLDPKKYLVLPNTSGAVDADEAVRIARLGRAAGFGDFVKLEIHPDPNYLLPDPIETLKASKILAGEGFKVMAYMNADPVLAMRLQDAGVAALMPLGAPIGTNRGLETRSQIEIIIEQADLPVVVDAGIGLPSHAAQAMEIGSSAVLINTAIAVAENPVEMAKAFSLAVRAGRTDRLSGAAATLTRASATSPLTGFLDE